MSFFINFGKNTNNNYTVIFHHLFPLKDKAISVDLSSEERFSSIKLERSGLFDYFAFNQAINLVDNAPKFKNWKFLTFIQPIERIDKIIDGFDKPYIFHEITLKASKLKFLILNYDEKTQKFDIIVFLKTNNLYCDINPLNQIFFYFYRILKFLSK